MKKVRKETSQKSSRTSYTKRLCPILLAAIASLFPWQAEPVRADLDTSNSLSWILNSDAPNPYKSIIGSGPNTPSNQNYTLTINADATAFPSGNNPAISLNDNWTVYVYGTVQNQANGGGGLWNAGPNTIESRSNTTIIIDSGGQVLATGSQNNGEAINLIGNYNQITNYGLVQSRTGAAIWFQDTITSPANSNEVDNYGTIRTLRGSNYSAIGNSGQNGVIFRNRTGAVVDGSLSFAGGDDQLIFEPDSIVTGSINGGGGTNTLTLEGAAGTSGSLAGALRNFTTLTKEGDGTWTITGTLTGFDDVEVDQGTLRLTGDNSGFDGKVNINSVGNVTGTLEAKARSLPTTSSNVGNITNNGVLRFVDSLTDDDGGIGNYAGQITGTGIVEMTGTGIVTLENLNNTYSGGTYVKNGTLGIATMATLGTGELYLGSGTSPTATMGTLRLANADINITKDINLLNGGGAVDTNGYNGVVSGKIAHGGSFTKAGEGTLTVTNNDNDYAGGTYITGGTLEVGDGGTNGNIPYVGIIDITNSGTALAINRSDTVTINTRITGAGEFIQRGSGTTILGPLNYYSGGTSIENGTLQVSSNLSLGSGTGALSFGTATTNGTLLMAGNVDTNGRNVTLNAGGGTINTNGYQGMMGGVISGSGGLTKTGAGQLTLTGENTYTGTTTINQGAVQLGNGGTSGSILSDVVMNNNTSLIFNRSDNLNVLPGKISGQGNLIQRGTGTTTLTGVNSYTNGTVIENGTVAINSDTALGAVTGSLTFGTATTDGTLKLIADIDNLADQRNVIINNGGGTIDTGDFHGTTGAVIQGTGHLNKTGTGTLTLTADSTYTGGTTVRNGELELGDNTAGGVGSVIGNVEVQGTGTIVYNRADDNTDPAGTVFGSGNVIQRGSGTTTITNDNTYTGSTTLQGGTLAISEDAHLGRGGAVIFDGGKLQLNDDLTDFNPNRTVTLQSSGTIDTLGNTGTIGAVIGGSGTLTKDGSGILVLTGNNTYTGNTTIADGTLKIGDGGNSGSILGNVANNGTLIFDRDGTVTYPGVISGTGNVIQQGGASGNGTTIFTGNSTYTGGTDIVSGTLQLGNGGTSGNIVGNVTNDGTLAFNRSDSFIFSGTVSGTGDLVQKGTGTTILTGTNTYTGGTLISSGALQIGNCGTTGSITGNVVNNSQLIFSRSDDLTGSNAFGGVISGTGSVVKDCTNVLELTADNTFTGGTELRRGGLLMTNASSLGTMGTGDSMSGHVWYSTTGSDTARTFEVSATDLNGDPLDHIENHFHVLAGSQNSFQINDDLKISGVTNNSSQQNLGGAFYVASASTLDINIGQAGQSNVDLVLDENSYHGTENDLYVDGTLKLNVAGLSGTNNNSAVFINSGTAGSGSLDIWGNGTSMVQISADSSMGTTNVHNTALRLVDGITYANNVVTLDSVASLQGNGTLSATGSITIAGNFSPDSAIFDTDNKSVGTNNIGTLTVTGAPTMLDGFTFTYDVVGPNVDADGNPTSNTNDLVRFGSQDVTITGGTINFITAGSAGLETGRYLVFDSTAAKYLDAGGTTLTEAQLNQVLKGQVNGISHSVGSPRLSHEFQFGTGTATNSQIWLDIERNTLQVVWQGGSANWASTDWQSVQQNGGTHANDFNDGDLAIFDNHTSSTALQKATLDSNIIVSGLQVNTVLGNTTIANIEITGSGGISAKKTDPSIVGQYANSTTDPQRFDTTGKLEMRGRTVDIDTNNLTTLTISNTGTNTFEEGIDLYDGMIILDGPDGRLGTYGSDPAHANAGLVTFKDPQYSVETTEGRVVAVSGQNQTLVNRFAIEQNLNRNYIVANAVTATITGIIGENAIEIGNRSALTLYANGSRGNIFLTGNGNDIAIGQNAQLNVTGSGNVFVRSGMTGQSGSNLIKTDTGTLQIEANSDADNTLVTGGIFRVTNGVTYGLTGSSSFIVPKSGTGTVAGAGTIQAQTIEIQNVISPDNLNAADPNGGSRYGTLTFNTTEKLEFQDFTLDFDVAGPTINEDGTRPSQAYATDLLVVDAAPLATLTRGKVNFRTENNEAFRRGDYLVVKSSNSYDTGSRDKINDSLTALVNGAAINGNTPRGDVQFELRDSVDGSAGGDKKDIWLVNELNSLSMDWFGDSGDITDPGNGNWQFGVDRMLSAQESAGLREYQFMNGDKVFIYQPDSSATAITVTLNAPGPRPMNVTVSGLVVGKTSGGAGGEGAGVTHDGNVTIDGLGSITADASSAFGAYLQVGTANGQPLLMPTGSLQKYGSGGLLIRNTGGNHFLGGTELYDGSISIGHKQALGEVDGTGNDFDGYVFFTGADNITRTVTVQPIDPDGNLITNIQNHFRAVSNAGTNVFQIANPLTISGVANDNVATMQGGAFYVETGSNLTIDADGDLTLSGNSAGSVSNDIYANGTLNLDVAAGKGIFVNSGLAGSGTVNIGSGLADSTGFVQIAAESNAEGTSNVNSGSTLRVVNAKRYGSSVHTFNMDTGSNLEGNGVIYAKTATISGNISPDAMIKTTGADIVSGDDRYAVLRIAGAGAGTTTTLDKFTFDYDARQVNASQDGPTDTQNDLLLISDIQTINLGMADAAGTVGTIHFRTDTENNVTTLAAGKYLIVDTDDSGSGIRINMAWSGATSPNDVLEGTVNGTSFDTFSPRSGFAFRFNDTTEEAPLADSQIWLDVELNSLSMDWTAGNSTWNSTDENWLSYQTSGDGTTREKIFLDGDKVYFSGDTDFTVTLDDDVTVSGMVSGRDTLDANHNGNVTISGTGSITADASSAFGKFVNKTSTPLNPTGMLEKYGTGTLTLATETANFWADGTEIYGGTIKMSGTDVFGILDFSSSTTNGFVTFEGNGTNVVSTKTQTVQNFFLVNNGVQNARIATEDASGNNASHLTITTDNQSYAIVLNPNAHLILDAAEGDIIFHDNLTDIGFDDSAKLEFTGNQNIYLENGIHDEHDTSLKTVTRKKGGFTQIDKSSMVIANTTVENGGTFRVIQGITYGGYDARAGVTTFNLNGSTTETSGTLAGGGAIVADTFNINGTISPDKATLSTNNSVVSDADRIAILTLTGNNTNSEVTFQSVVDPGYPQVNDRTGFHFEYDVNAPNTVGDNPANTTNDLLQIVGMDSVKLEGGVVNFRTGTDGFKSGSYLVIDSNATITDGNGNAFVDDPNAGTVLDGINDYAIKNGVLWGKINGEDIRVGTPRRHLEFVLRNGQTVDSQIWIDVERNTLTMVRTAGGVWNTSQTAAAWTSEQHNDIGGTPVYEHVIERGDYARIYNPTTGSFEIVGSADQILSGLQLGNAGDSGDVVIAGNFGITTETTDADGWIEGIYLQGGSGSPTVPVDGKLIKQGDNTATFANTGTNTFEQGIELNGGILSYNNANQLLVGTDKAITFKSDATLRSDALADLNTAVVIDSGVTGSLDAGYGSTGTPNAMLVQKTVSGGGNLKKTGSGIVQFGVDSAIDGNATIEAGAFRIVDGTTFTSNAFIVDAGASLQGGGTVTAETTITVNGNISPDKANLTTEKIDVPKADKFGTLTLNANTVTLNGFTMDYDVNAPNISSDPADTPNDLLQITGATTLTDGLIALRDSSKDILANGDYLIVSADQTITVAGGKELDGINNLDGALSASYNGNILVNTTPRQEFGFEFRDYNGVTDSQIWLTNEVNTLYMNWNAGTNDWGGTDSWTSSQSTLSGGRATQFLDGDFVSFSDRTGDSTANLTGPVIVSGLDTNTNQTVLITGNGGIHATKDDPSMIGKFVKPNGGADTNKQEFDTTGLFRKYGTGTTTFANNGTNLFEEGIELYGGILSYNNADQLTVNDDKAMTFVESATLRADATADLDTSVVVNADKTATFHADENVAMLLQKTVSGDGNLMKTGDGIVQLGVTSTIGGDAEIEAGAFRVVENTTFTAANVLAEATSSLQGGGTISADTITVYGHISPDAATLTTANTDVPDADKFGTLTLSGNVSLGKLSINSNDPDEPDVREPFIFDYDLGTAYTGTDPSHDPTGDLLKIVGSVNLAIGHVGFQGELETGKYLIVDSDTVIDIGNNVLDGINDLEGILTASLNGNVLSNDTPRHELGFQFENDQKQIWLETEVNTLFMSWIGGTGLWTDTKWESSQKTLSGDRETSFRGGDFVVFTDTTQDSDVTLNSNVIVGGLDSNTGKNVVISGTGGIHAKLDDSSMIGEYVKTDGTADPMQQQFNTSGLFRKYGTGTTTFTNIGGNLFDEGIELYQGTTEFNRGDQLAVGTGKQITFKGDSTLRPTASLAFGTNIGIDDNVTGTFDAASDIVFDYNGTMTGSTSSAFSKIGTGTMNLRSDSPDYRGSIDITAGTFGVYANYGNSKSFKVRDGAVLTGTGTIGGLDGSSIIETGGTLAPRGYTSGSANVTYLTVNGSLLFDSGSNFDVTISQNPNDIGADGKMAPVSDYVKVQNGSVDIDSAANLNVVIDYWNGALTINDFNETDSSKFTVIDATEGSVANDEAQFTLNLSEVLPRGVKIAQGWQNYENGWMTFGDGWLYQLWFEKDSDHDFEHLCDRHNRVEIGKNLDQLVLAGDSSMADLINHLSSSCFSDAEVCNLLDQLTGDLRANSLMMAMKTPWRSPFSRLDGVRRISCDPCSPIVKKNHRFQLWGEWTARYDDVRSDRNAHPFTINRMGVAVGADKRLSHRTTFGLAFNYSDPRLRQATGKAEMDDYEIGLYGRTRLNNDWMLKYYAGYSHQNYDLRRHVYIPACPADGFSAINERFRNKTNGDALAMSFELIRTFQIRNNLRLLPSIAFDFNQAWQDGYRESGGLTALEYDDTTLERMMMRFGLGAEYAVRNNVDLKARIQYATQLNSVEYPRSGTRFANATIADQRYADIWGTRIGRDSLNLGIGMDWKPARFQATTVFINYDADLYKRATIHAGQFGFATQW